jgi:hypothetical protein
VASDFTVYCHDCSRPLLLRRRGSQYPVAGVDVLEADGEGVAVARCMCGVLWRRDSQYTANLVR